MNSETKRILVSHILEKTKEGSLDLDETKESFTITDEALNEILDELKTSELIQYDGTSVSVSLEQRIELAVLAIRLGADFEKISKSLGWLEFEELVARVFRENGYISLV